MNPKLELQQIEKSYGNKKVLNKLSLEVSSGEFFVILGPSGEGKSTLLRIMAGIEKPDNGRVMIDGRDVTGLPPNKRNIAMVFQSYALYPNMNVYDNIAFPLKMRGVPKSEAKQKVLDAAKLLRIDDIINEPVTKISGGQKQRVALARALVRSPSVFLLDEPLSNLDARVRYLARVELKRIQKKLGETFILVTHDQKDASSLADRVGVLHEGRFEQVGTPNEIYDKPSTKWVGQFVGDLPMNFLPSQLLGLGQSDGEVGFRPEWVTVGEGESECVLESVERAGDEYYLFCRVGEDYRIVLKGATHKETGETIRFKLRKFNRYSDSALRETAEQSP
jgi:trehalose transport system ATP-binding protein